MFFLNVYALLKVQCVIPVRKLRMSIQKWMKVSQSILEEHFDRPKVK
jgi:hypothetical protein